ncbi:MAG: NADH-quinone oxidoreductase subunit C, partial [Acetobacteraceae bacterium]|nr:NADH-quinone oxidoreductase subunit C [Acetobacteraceae bacterium]
MASCSSRRRSGGRGRSCVARLDDLAVAAAALPGVERAGLELGELVLHARPGDLPALMLTLRDDGHFACEQMMDLCGVDWPERDPRFDLVYNLLSVSLNHRVRVVAGVAEGEAAPSIHQVWPVATWFEREAWDLFGIPFDGQPDLRRILTDYGFSGHPLRKDFPLTGFVECRWDDERKQVIYEPVTLTQD